MIRKHASSILESHLRPSSKKVQPSYVVLSDSHDHQIFYFHPTNHNNVYAGLFPLRAPLILGEDFISLQVITVVVRRLGSLAEQFG